MDFGRVLGTLASFFEREAYRYAAVGAFGLHAYGLARATLDLDLVTESAAQPKLVAFLESLGYETLYRSSGYSNHVHALVDLGRLDFVYVESETGRRLFGGGTTLQLGEHRVPVPRPEHLVAMKVHAMKNDPSRTCGRWPTSRSLEPSEHRRGGGPRVLRAERALGALP